MRHRKSGRKLNRNSSHRKALMKNLAIAFIERELIKTTVPKAKELRGFVEPLITLAKVDSVANRRRAFSKLRMDSIVDKLLLRLLFSLKIVLVDIFELSRLVLDLVIKLIWPMLNGLIELLIRMLHRLSLSLNQTQQLKAPAFLLNTYLYRISLIGQPFQGFLVQL